MIIISSFQFGASYMEPKISISYVQKRHHDNNGNISKKYQHFPIYGTLQLILAYSSQQPWKGGTVIPISHTHILRLRDVDWSTQLE